MRQCSVELDSLADVGRPIPRVSGKCPCHAMDQPASDEPQSIDSKVVVIGNTGALLCVFTTMA